ncbi:hypothetical protein CP533_4049 [Ophiocordyceps camponoti-saundersi (nom. inval.)]|nr:hypothetical protein CP533_4049 [Ophiocordyceps camponoti-saundersi (nom. inval.)]
MVPQIRLRWHMSAPRSRHHPRFVTTTTPISQLLSSPTWSVRSLRGPEPASETESISPERLRQLLRHASLPPPKSEQEESTMIATLQSQLRFVRAVQSVDTTGVDPLRSIRDETEVANSETTVKLSDLQPALAKEVPVGHHKRPTRVRDESPPQIKDWDPLATASKKAGRYFVVDAGKKKKASS